MEISVKGEMNEKKQKELQLLLKLDFAKMEPGKAFSYLGRLIDLSYDQKFLQGTEKAIEVGENLLKSLKSSKDKALLYYFLANAYSDKHKIEYLEKKERVWAWESLHFEKTLLYLRHAILDSGFSKLSTGYKASILTNLGNILSQIGRPLEAIEYWDKSLLYVEGFPMTLGNKGIAIALIADTIYDIGHRCILYHFAKI